MVNYEFTEQEKQELIAYGIERCKVSILFTLFVLLMGAICGVFREGIIFWSTFCLIRQYAGGYHADTQKRCSIISSVTITLLFIGMRHITISIPGIMVLQVGAYIIIIALSPVGNRNRELDMVERKVFRIKACITATLVMFASGVLYLLEIKEVVLPIVMANVILAISLVVGVIKNNLVRYRGKSI